MAVHGCQSRGAYSGRTRSVPHLPLAANYRRKPRGQSVVDVKTSSPRQRTMESVRGAFHAQLATVMDSLLAAAVCEIAKIFESSLCEQQAELAQKTQEIAILRGRVERRQRAKGGGGEEGEISAGDREDGLRLKTELALEADWSGQTDTHFCCTGKDGSPHSDPAAGLSHTAGGLKEEATGQDGASIKHETGHSLQCVGSRPTMGSVAVQAPEGTLDAEHQRQIDPLSAPQAKTKLSHWDQDSRSADHRPLQDQASPPFLSISQSGRCSPRPDPSLAQPGEWLPGLDAARGGGVSGLENLQPDGTGCSGPAGSSPGADAPCFRPGFGSDETSNEDDSSSFPFLDQEPENQNSTHNSAQGQGEAESQEDQPQALSGESLWRPRDDRGGRGPVNHVRRLAAFGNRDPLRPQSNSQLLALRHANALSHAPAPSAGSGRPYTCPYCTKCFTYPSHQRRHLLRHTGVRLHPCQFCDKSFLTPSELTVHTRTHTGERPFGCTQCGKRFARSGNLRAHQRDVHMGKRPFACTECGKRFAHRGNLRVHNHRVHQGDPYYMDEQQEPDIGPNPI